MASIKQATGDIVTEVTAQTIKGSKVASKAWRALILANRLNYLYPKDTLSNISNLVGATNIEGLGRILEIKNLHWARRISSSIAEKTDYAGIAVVRRTANSGKAIGSISEIQGEVSRTALAVTRNLGVPRDVTTKEDTFTKFPSPPSSVKRNGKVVVINTHSTSRETGVDSAMAAAVSRQTVRTINNSIIIFNTHTSPYTSIVIQNRPNEIQVNPQSTWVAIKSMGRNNPFYMYTGGEDTITFDISWYVSDPDHLEEVLAKCRLLESWTKANGYDQAPPTLKISWGNADLFKNRDFILESCPYRLTNFQNASRANLPSYQENTSVRSSEILDKGLYPSCATQTLTFKKVTYGNAGYREIIDLPLNGIRGINWNGGSSEVGTDIPDLQVPTL